LKKVIEIMVFGQPIRIRHEDEEYVKELESFISEKVEVIQRSQKASSTVNLAARAVITLADEYLSLSKEKERITREIQDKTSSLIKFIDTKMLV